MSIAGVRHGLQASAPRAAAAIAAAYSPKAPSTCSQIPCSARALCRSWRGFIRPAIGAPAIRRVIHGEVCSTILFKLGALCQLRGRDEQARPFLERALDVRKNVCGETHPATELVRENLRLLGG